jgi:hypothetical protein
VSLTPTPLPTDDPECFAVASRWITAAIYRSVPADAYVVRIDNWFGDRWLSFSGKIAGALGVRSHGEDMTLPPFHPRRVEGRRHFRRYETLDDYVRVPTSRPVLHPSQHSEANLNRTLAKMFGDVLLAWFGGGSESDDRASLMVYRRTAYGNAEPWYASFSRHLGWRPDRTIGLGESERKALETYVDDATVPT